MLDGLVMWEFGILCSEIVGLINIAATVLAIVF